MRFRDLLLCQLAIASQFCDANTKGRETLGKRVNLFLNKSLHGRHVDNLKGVLVNETSGLVAELGDRSKNGQGGTVGLRTKLISGTRQWNVTLTFPAPVGAQINIGSLVPQAIGNTLL